ncbi:MAG TPA: IS3 family transposase [Pseudosphingobacterium sp.]|nr:IS3 family transposase [Pseudosphingobacterium sp.]
MSRKRNCWDNAPMESFFKSMKTEMVYHHHFFTANKARTAIFDYIECWYNRRWKHSRLGYLSPEEFGKNLIKSIA